MIEKLLPKMHREEDTLRRSVIKTFVYRIIVLTLDFVAIYFFSGQIKIAIGFVIVSNLYATLCYFIHERIWDKIKWGKIIFKNVNME